MARPNARNPNDIPKRNAMSHIRSPASHALMSRSKNPAAIEKYHQANSLARSPFPKLMCFLDAFSSCECQRVL